MSTQVLSQTVEKEKNKNTTTVPLQVPTSVQKPAQAKTPAPGVAGATVSSVRGMKDFTAAKHDFNLGLFQTAAQNAVAPPVANQSKGFDSNVDYGTLIRDLSLQPTTAENQAKMRELMAARQAKIAADGNLSQFADDEVSALGRGYINQFAPQDMNTDEVYDAADALARKNYDEAAASLRNQQRLQQQNQMQIYAAQRRAADLAYAKNARGMEDMLANQGIGRGLGAAPSSGYSESARLGALANYSNDINQSHQQQAAAERELAAQFEAQRMQAMSERNTALMNNYAARVSQMNDDRQFGFDVHNKNAENRRADYESDVTVDLTTAQARNLDADTDATIAKTPSEIAQNEAAAGKTRAETADIEAKTPVEVEAIKANTSLTLEQAKAEAAKTKLTEAETEKALIEITYLAEKLQYENDKIRAEAAKGNEEAIYQWIINQYSGDLEKAKLVLAELTNIATAKEINWYDALMEAEIAVKQATARNAGGSGTVTPAPSGSRNKKSNGDGSKSGSSGGESPYGDDIVADIQATLDGPSPDTQSVIDASYSNIGKGNEDIVFVENGVASQPSQEAQPDNPWTNHSIYK